MKAGTEGRLITQAEAARLRDMREGTFRRYLARYGEAGLDGLTGKRLAQVAHHS